MTQHPVNLDDIRRAQSTLKGRIQSTETRVCPWDPNLYFKFENEQLTGSFKIRGALNCMLNLSDAERAHGVVASSAGNHAQGVALSAQITGMKAHIVMPITAPLVKVNATRSYGANVILHGEFYDEAYAHALELEKQHHYTFVHPYLDPRVIAGQGTIGLELLEAIADLEAVVVPIGGGGLLSGIATAVKSLKPSIKVYGVVSDTSPAMMQLFHSKGAAQISPVPARIRRATIAEGIAVKNASPDMHKHYISRLVDDIVSVSDDEIATAIVALMEKSKAVVEGSGAAGVASIMAGKLPQLQGRKTAVILCGGNIDLNVIARVIERGLRSASRLARVSVIADDLPGNLLRLTEVMAKNRANVLEVLHDRVSPELGLRETRIDLLVETLNAQQIGEIKSQLAALGFKVR
jgi:threonine dehydratase